MPVRKSVWSVLHHMVLNADSKAKADENCVVLREQWDALTSFLKEVTCMPVHGTWSHEDFHRYMPRNFTIANNHVSKILVMLEDLRVAEKFELASQSRHPQPRAHVQHATNSRSSWQTAPEAPETAERKILALKTWATGVLEYLSPSGGAIRSLEMDQDHLENYTDSWALQFRDASIFDLRSARDGEDLIRTFFLYV